MVIIMIILTFSVLIGRAMAIIMIILTLSLS